MKALSIKQPWASLIAQGIKDIENRTWRTNFRGAIYIHVSGKPIDRAKLYDVLNQDQWDLVFDASFANNFDADNIYYSAIIGQVDIIDCVINHNSIWAEQSPGVTKSDRSYLILGKKPIWNWVLANPVLYEKPILNVKGKLSFWEPDIDIQKCIGCSQKFDLEEMEEDDGGEKFCPECWEVLSPVMAQEAKECSDQDQQ